MNPDARATRIQGQGGLQEMDCRLPLGMAGRPEMYVLIDAHMLETVYVKKVVRQWMVLLV